MSGTPERSGLFITLEGGDGSGKGTQARLATEWMQTFVADLETSRYPQYGNPSAAPVEMLLRGEFGGIDDVPPIAASSLYSFDRVMHKSEIKTVLDRGGVYLSDRYTHSNSGHNGAKFNTDEERLKFYEFLQYYEYELLGIPKPDHNFLVLTDPDVAQQNVDRKDARSYTTAKRDIHEADIDHLFKTYESYRLLASTYPEQFTIIDSMDPETGEMRSPEDIHLLFREPVMNLLRHHNIVLLDRASN